MSEKRTREAGVDARPMSVRLDLVACRSSLAVVRMVAESFVRASPWHDVSDDELREILLVILEACGNVVMHAYPDQGEGALAVELGLSPEGIRVQVRDQGPGFGLEQIEEMRGPAGDDLRGWGLHLMRGLSDSLTVESRDGGNVVTMTRRIGEGRAAPAGRAGERR